MVLLFNDVSHWLGANLESALFLVNCHRFQNAHERTCLTNAIPTAVVEAHFVDDLSWRPTIVSPLARICAQVGEALVKEGGDGRFYPI